VAHSIFDNGFHNHAQLKELNLMKHMNNILAVLLLTLLTLGATQVSADGLSSIQPEMNN
jgi:hypothetical protein